MFNWVLNTPLELHEKNKEKQAFLLIHCTTCTLYLVSVGTYVFSAILQRKRN